MTTSNEIVPGFNRPRPTDDPYMIGQYHEHGLGDAPSLESIEPVAIRIMNEGNVLQAIELVMGRRIGSAEAKEDPVLATVALGARRDPQQAFGLLLVQLALEEGKRAQ